MKSLTEQQLRDLMQGAYALAISHSYEITGNALSGTMTPEKRQQISEETKAYIDKAVASV